MKVMHHSLKPYISSMASCISTSLRHCLNSLESCLFCHGIFPFPYTTRVFIPFPLLDITTIYSNKLVFKSTLQKTYASINHKHNICKHNSKHLFTQLCVHQIYHGIWCSFLLLSIFQYKFKYMKEFPCLAPLQQTYPSFWCSFSLFLLFCQHAISPIAAYFSCCCSFFNMPYHLLLLLWSSYDQASPAVWLLYTSLLLLFLFHQLQ